MRSSIKRWTPHDKVPCFQNLKDFGSFFNEHHYDQLYFQLRTQILEVGTTGEIMVAIFNEYLIYTLSKIIDLPSQSIRLYCDATFDFLPRSLLNQPNSKKHQYFTVMIQIYDLVSYEK